MWSRSRQLCLCGHVVAADAADAADAAAVAAVAATAATVAVVVAAAATRWTGSSPPPKRSGLYEARTVTMEKWNG